MTDRVADLLEAAATDPDDTERVQTFVDALLDSEVIAFEFAATDDTPGQPLMVSDHKGKVWPIFSSLELAQSALEELGGDSVGAHAVYYKCRDLWTQAVYTETRTALNILDDYSKEFLVPEMLEYLAPGQVMVGVPPNVPDDLRFNLFEFIAAKPAVKKAYLAWTVHPDGHAGYLLVVVTDTPSAEITKGIESIAPYTQDTSMDVLVLPVAEADVNTAAHIEPFFIGLDL